MKLFSSRCFNLFILHLIIYVSSKKPNFIVLLTDDQDLRHKSMIAMPYTAQYVGNSGINMSNHFINTPICCPSRTTLLSGRFEHNNRVSGPNEGGCMRMNTSRDDNPMWWKRSFVRTLHEQGYTTGLFGKVLNKMNTYGCKGGKSIPGGIDRAYYMCNGAGFYKQDWFDQGKRYTTGNEPENYTTSLIGNRTLEWIRSVIGKGESHPPFFAYLGPHAPHLPATPAPWYLDHPIGNNKAPREIYYNYTGKGKHSFLPNEPIIDKDDATAIDVEYAKRLRSLLSVDDIMIALREYLVSVNEWDNTYVFFTSDHGYNLGQFRVDSHKTMVYDHSTRVPMLIRGPNIKSGTESSIISSMADLGPTILELAAGGNNESAVPAYMDGSSFAMLFSEKPGISRSWKSATLIEYQSIRTKITCEKNKHPHDGPNNTFSAIRIISKDQDFLYAEFADVTDPHAWTFPPDSINYYELYNVSADYYLLNNIYPDVSKKLQNEFHTYLHQAINCEGNQDCTTALSIEVTRD